MWFPQLHITLQFFITGFFSRIFQGPFLCTSGRKFSIIWWMKWKDKKYTQPAWREEAYFQGAKADEALLTINRPAATEVIYSIDIVHAHRRHIKNAVFASTASRPHLLLSTSYFDTTQVKQMTPHVSCRCAPCDIFIYVSRTKLHDIHQQSFKPSFFPTWLYTRMRAERLGNASCETYDCTGS